MLENFTILAHLGRAIKSFHCHLLQMFAATFSGPHTAEQNVGNYRPMLPLLRLCPPNVATLMPFKSVLHNAGLRTSRGNMNPDNGNAAVCIDMVSMVSNFYNDPYR